MGTITKRILLVVCAVLLAVTWGEAQIMYQYLLKENFHAQQSGAPDLIQVQNNGGETGEFVIRQVPTSTCGQQGNAPGYFFEDDAGLIFRNPAGFINQEYTIAFNFQFDEFIDPPGWVRILSFTHYDDVGIYMNLTSPPNTATLEFWPYGLAGTYDFFNTVDFFQLILVRSTAGIITVYANGSEFATYDDSFTQAYVPQDTANFIIWFRDDPSVLSGEASPGFVSDIRIGNYSWTPIEVQEAWSRFCSSLLGTEDGGLKTEAGIYPNPADQGIFLQLPPGSFSALVYDITGQQVLEQSGCTGILQADVSALHPGIYVLRLTGDSGSRVYRFVKR
jgi:hypothetical protein